MWNTLYNNRKEEEDLWIKVPMTCKSIEDKTNVILALMDLLERNIKIYPHE